MTYVPLVPPPQIQFELYEHTNVYRKPLVGDYYQSVDGIVIHCEDEDANTNIQRWILHPKEPEVDPQSETSGVILQAQETIDTLLEDARIFLRRRIGEVLFNLRQELK